jgi:pimeloyl-ACP methyl ester carboxylesterase
MKTIQLNNIKLAYEDRGSGQVVVLLHGYPLDHRMWEPQIEALSKTCRVVAPDLRGFGQSTQASEDAASGVTMSQYATDVANLLDAIGVTEPVILCGFSMGGYILWRFVRQFPERVKAIVPCDTRAVADTTEARQGRLKTAGEVASTGVEPIITAMLPKLLSEATRNSRPDIVVALTAIMHSCSPAAIAASLRGMADRPDVTDELTKIWQPALVFVGAEDVISSSDEMRGIADKMPDAEFVEISNAGHMTTLENPTAVNIALLDFVKRCS